MFFERTGRITYTGTSAGAVYNLKGTIAPDGSVSGTADSNCQTFTMPAGSASSKHQVRHDDQDEKDDKDSDDIKVLPI